MEKNMENYIETGITQSELLGLYRGLYRDNGKEIGSYYLGFRV